MSESIIIHTLSSSPVHQRVADGYINLNQIADAAAKRIDNWTRLQETTSLLREFQTDPLYEGIDPLIVIEGRGGGTWAHPDIAIQFAQWCNPAFALQVSRWVRQWMTTARNPLSDIDRFELRVSLKDDSRIRACDQVKVYLEQIKRYDDKKFRGQFFANFHDSLNRSITGETSRQMRERLSFLLGRTVKEDELIRDYFPSSVLQRYISMCEAAANLMLKEGLHPITAIERATEIVLPVGFRPTPVNFVEHIKYVQQRLISGQGGFELPGF